MTVLERLRRGWLDQPLATKGMVVIAVPVLILLVALLTVVHELRQEEAAEANVQRALQVQTDLQRLETLVYRAALSAATRSPPPRDGYRASEPPQKLPNNLALDIGRLLDDLDRHIADETQHRYLRSLAPATSRFVATVQPLSSAEGNGDVDGASELATTTGALAAFDFELNRMLARETELLTLRSAAAENARAHSLLVIAVAVLVGLLGSVAAVFLFSSVVVKRITRLAANAQAVFSLDVALAPAPRHQDEVGALGIALDHAAQLLAQRQQRLEELVARLFDVQEEERRRVAYQLHDGLAQLAAAAHQHLQAFAARYPPTSPEAQSALHCGLELVQRSVRETRDAIAGLRPTVLDDLGLFAALEIEADALRREGRAVRCQHLDPGARFPPLMETALFRIAQEALVNVRKHAGAQAAVDMTLGPVGGPTLLRIHDNGDGFSAALPPSPSTTRTAPGEKMGLEIMRERALLVGARLNVHSAERQGTTILVVVC